MRNLSSFNLIFRWIEGIISGCSEIGFSKILSTKVALERSQFLKTARDKSVFEKSVSFKEQSVKLVFFSFYK